MGGVVGPEATSIDVAAIGDAARGDVGDLGEDADDSTVREAVGTRDGEIGPSFWVTIPHVGQGGHRWSG